MTEHSTNNIVPLVKKIALIAYSVSPFGIIDKWRNSREWKVREILDYQLVWIVIELLAVFLLSSYSRWEWFCKLAIVLLILRLFDMFLGFLKPLYSQGYSNVSAEARLGFLSLNIFEVCIIFGCLIMFYGRCWDPNVETVFRGMYISVTNLATLGAGDYTPLTGFAGDVARIIVLLEVIFSAMFLIFGVALLTAEQSAGN